MSFYGDLQAIAARNESWLCVGLDPDLDKIPAFLKEQHGDDAIIYFNKAIIDATRNFVCSYKPNSAFYEALGPMGLEMLKVTRELIPREIPMILDVKRGDMGNTAQKYAEAAFNIYGADAVTLNPFQGFDSIEPFSGFDGKGLFVLTRTSNPSSKEIQDLEVSGQPLYVSIALLVSQWQQKSPRSRLGAVVGATVPDELKKIRELLGDEAPILIPGIGAQGGDLEVAVKSGTSRMGTNAIINASRSILYASSAEDFSEAAAKEAQRLRDQINRAVQTI